MPAQHTDCEQRYPTGRARQDQEGPQAGAHCGAIEHDFGTPGGIDEAGDDPGIQEKLGRGGAHGLPDHVITTDRHLISPCFAVA